MKKTFALLLLSLAACGEALDKDGDGFDELTGDCNDGDAEISPAAIEICDGIDNDCNGEIDELGAKGGTIFYVDLDGDGHGSENGTLEACSLPDGYSTSKRDCDESRAEVNPDADEICDGIDNDCDTNIDEYTAVDAPTWYPDRDGDGYGDMDAGILGCEAPPDHVLDGSDCDDVDPGVNPDATESCETPFDDDCDGEVNEVDAFGCSDFYADFDGDGFGGTSLCLCEGNEEYSFDVGGDCNDQNALISPASEEVIDLMDNDCDGVAEYPLEQADVLLQLENKNRRVYQLGGGDFNGDGFADILVGHDADSQVSLLYGPDIPAGLLSENRDVVFYGSSDQDISRFEMLSLDHNNDGMDDVLLNHISIEGATSFIFEAPFAEELYLEDAVAQLVSSNSNQQMFHTRGDFNGDGVADLVVVDEKHDDIILGLIGTQSDLGRAAIFLSPLTGELTMDDADQIIIGGAEEDALGQDVESGDFNGDGVADLMLSSLSGNNSHLKGSLHIFHNFMGEEAPEANSVVFSDSFFMYIGENLGRPTDFNGDGHLDQVFTTHRDHGHHVGANTVIAYGPFADGIHDIGNFPLTVFYDPVTDEETLPMHCISVVGDITGDGKSDLLIGDRYQDGNGAIYLIDQIQEGFWNLSQSGVSFNTNGFRTSYIGTCRDFNQPFLRNFMSPGDINGDGVHDLLIAARQSDENDGSIYSQVSLIWGGEQ